MNRRIFCLITLILLLCSGCGQKDAAIALRKPTPLPSGTKVEQNTIVSGEKDPAFGSLADFRVVAEKDGAKLCLLYNQKDLIVAYQQQENGQVIYSSPADYAVGESPVMQAGAQLIVEYADVSGNVRTVSSLTGAVRAKTADVTTIENGLQIVYRFTKAKENFEIPIQFLLTQEGLEATVLFENISEKGTSTILNISFLPFMGCASAADEGYIFVPDGSGALIDFKGKSSDDTSYSSVVYGRDPVLSVSLLSNVSQNIYLPVFGIKKQNSSVLAEITSGESLATVKAYQIKDKSIYANVYPVFNFRTRDEVSLSDAWNAQKFTQSAVHPNQLASAKVCYSVLEDADAGYVGMAKEYRKCLEARGVSNTIAEDVPLYVDVLGAVKKTQSVFGFPQTVVVPFTTYEQASQILTDLGKKDIAQINMRYLGGMKGGLDDAVILKPTTEKKLGGSTGWENLKATAEKFNAKLAMNAEMVNIYNGRSGWKPYQCATQNVYRMPVKISSFELSTKLPKKEKNAPVYYLLAPSKLEEAAAEFFSQYDAASFGDVAYGSLGNTIYADFAETRFTDRSQAQNKITGVLESASKDGKVWLDGGNSYALPYASAIIGAPMYDSGTSITKFSVPFYQITLHGLVEYTQPASNLDTEPDKMLKLLESGSIPYYMVSFEDVFNLQGTNENWIFSGTWKDTEATLEESYAEISKVLNGLNNVPITDHRIVNDTVRVTVYGDKTAVILNYSDEAADCFGESVPAHGYRCITADQYKGATS